MPISHTNLFCDEILSKNWSPDIGSIKRLVYQTRKGSLRVKLADLLKASASVFIVSKISHITYLF